MFYCFAAKKMMEAKQYFETFNQMCVVSGKLVAQHYCIIMEGTRQMLKDISEMEVHQENNNMQMQQYA